MIFVHAFNSRSMTDELIEARIAQRELDLGVAELADDVRVRVAHGGERVPELVADAGRELADGRQLLRPGERLVRGLKAGESALERDRLVLLADRERLRLSAAIRDVVHLVDAAEAAENEDDVLVDHPEGVLDEPPPLGVEDAVYGLGPEDPSEEVVGRHDDSGRDENRPIAVKCEEG